MRDYEVVVIIHPDLDEAAVKGAVEKIQGWITAAGGLIVKTDMWGKRRMSYVIRKQREGQYVLVHGQFAPSFTSELERNLRFLEPVMRFMITAVEPTVEKTVEKAVETVVETAVEPTVESTVEPTVE